jgi:hypothetical protein
MKKHVSYLGSLMVALSALVAVSVQQPAQAHGTEKTKARDLEPVVFQAAGPSAASIQSMVDAFRAAIGGANNGNIAGPIADGRREINWDGGGSTATSIVPTPFDGFLVTRGGRFTTRGDGFVQAPVEGLAATFNNPSYATVFKAFSPVRLFSPLDSNVTTARFFVPGGGEVAATTNAFGAVFSDVDQEDGKGGHGAATSLLFYGVHGELLYRAEVPASAGDASFSFAGVLFDEARVAFVRIRTGNTVPGADDSRKRDVVMMDDFVYGEPQAIVESGSQTPPHHD